MLRTEVYTGHGRFDGAAQQLHRLSLGVVVAMFFILSSAFGSSRDATLIMLNLPLALVGGVLGVYLAGGVLSVASIVGFITLSGIATRNKSCWCRTSGICASTKASRTSVLPSSAARQSGWCPFS